MEELITKILIENKVSPKEAEILFKNKKWFVKTDNKKVKKQVTLEKIKNKLLKNK